MQLEWIDASRLDLSHEVEWPQPEKPEKKKTGVGNKAPSKNAQKRARADSRDVSATPDLLTGKNVNVGKAQRPSKAGGKENRDGTPLSMPIVTAEAISTDGTPKAESDDVEMVDVSFTDGKASKKRRERWDSCRAKKRSNDCERAVV